MTFRANCSLRYPAENNGCDYSLLNHLEDAIQHCGLKQYRIIIKQPKMESVLHSPFSPGWQYKNSELKISESRI